MAVSSNDVAWATLQYIALGIKVGRGGASEGEIIKFQQVAEFLSEEDAWEELDKYADMTEDQFIGYYKEKLEERRLRK